MICPNCGNEMKSSTCENCGTIVQSKPNVPPPQGGFKPQKKKKKWPLIILGVIVGFGLLGAIFGQSDKDSDNSSKTIANAESSNAGENDSKVEESSEKPSDKDDTTTYTCGDVFEIGDFEVTIGALELSEGSEYNRADEGKIYVCIPMEIKNISSGENHVSSWTMFDAYCDNIAINESVSAAIDKDYKSMDGTIASGKKVVGALSYELPKDWKTLEIILDANVWGLREKKATIIITNQ